jgi:ATP-dependent helicase HepA
MRKTDCPFVESSENSLGIGKLVSLDNLQGTIEYFVSPAHSEPFSQTVSRGSISRIFLGLQTRVYFRDPKTFGTKVGRVLDYQKDDKLYLVRFPNDESRLVPGNELQVRCSLPIVEPTDHLACQLNETAFWHTARSEFVRHLLEQQGTSLGLSALVSSSVELVAHQAAVIQRVLLDPFQRYLLADEVGLGKTIEAGVLIKQFSIDEPQDHTTLVIVPDTIVIQWRQELTHRFQLGHLLDNSIQVISYRDEIGIRRYAPTARMIVIDEAHHLSSWAWSENPIEQHIFSIVNEATCDLQRRVILLSATPVLHNERSFLAMLHLLDPQVYSLDSLDLFKERVQFRQEIAECMLSLTETESNSFVSDALNELDAILTDDVEFQSLRVRLLELIEDDISEDDPKRLSLIRSIRSHVSDIWRLHRRILRSRRNDFTAVYLPGRSGAKRIGYVCENERGLAEAVECWRLNLSACCFSSTELERHLAIELAKRVEEITATEPTLLIEWANRRLQSSFVEVTNSLPLQEGEVDHLNQIIRASVECDSSTKLDKLLSLVTTFDNSRCCVIFTDNKETADRVFNFLNNQLPAGKTLRHSTTNELWRQFRGGSGGYVLVCDHTAEEGLNLQRRGAIAIHFDIPFSPNRVEQRMGRLDRFGPGTPVETVVFVSETSSVQKNWFRLLDEGLGVFNRSIASLQYVIDDTLRQLWNEFFDAGADAFDEITTRLSGDEGEVATELKRIRAQDEIDSYDSDQITQQMADELEGHDRRLAGVSRQIFSQWAVHRLGFRQSGEEARRDEVFQYQFCRRVDSGNRPRGNDTLMPQIEFETRFNRSIDNIPCELPTRYTTVPLTFDRVAAQDRSARLLRVGDPFVDALDHYTRWDDRGVCFAFWRYCPSYQSVDDPDLFLRFDYVVSPNPTPLRELGNKTSGVNFNSLLRRCHTIMAPRFTTIWLDSNLDRVTPTDQRFGPFLKTAFGKSSHPWGKDYNLNYDRWKAASQLYEMSLWKDLCFAGRRKSETTLREHSRLPELSASCVKKAREVAQRVEQQYVSRISLSTGEILKSLQKELEFERAFLAAQIQAFSSPELRTDSVGAVFLSRQMPFVELREERGDDD